MYLSNHEDKERESMAKVDKVEEAKRTGVGGKVKHGEQL